MTVNPVFVNELRQSLFRRKPVLAIAIWASITGFLMYLTQFITARQSPIFWLLLPSFLLPFIVPAFAAGAFAKEYEQQTWQDLYLSRLSNFQVVTGKFFAALVQIMLMALATLPALMMALVQTGADWAYLPGLWTSVLLLKLLFSASLYILVAMVCSRYSADRRTALVWSYVGLFLYGLFGLFLWNTVGREATLFSRYPAYSSDLYTATFSQAIQLMAPSFMEQMHLIFCTVIGIGSMVLLWVSLSEQRGYKRGETGPGAQRAWQPIAHRRQRQVL
jgi:ABC-type transport system involved in multi-copper enzyme maturation permease subunit